MSAARGVPAGTGERAASGGLRWWIVFALIGPITFVMSLDRTAISVAAPTIQQEYGFSLGEMSLILTSFSVTYAFLQVPAGWFAEKVGPRRGLFAANALWSLLTAATPLGFSVASFVGIRALLGAGQAADWPASVLALKRWFPASERARGNSVLLGALYLGPIAAGPATTWIILALSWRWAFVFFGALGLVLGFLWWRFFRDSPREHPRIGAAEAAFIEAGQTGAGGVVQRGALRACLRSAQFWAIGVQYFFLVLIQSFYTTWLPTYLVQARGLSLKSMGFAASLPWVALFVMVFVAGRAADAIQQRTGSVWRARVPVAIAGFVVSSLALIAATQVADVIAMMALLCLSLGAIGLTQVSIWSATQDLGGAATGVVSGWTNCWGNSAGFVGPVALAWLVGLTGSWAGGVLLVAGAGLAGAVLWLFVRPERPIPALAG